MTDNPGNMPQLNFDTVAALAPWQPVDDRVMGGVSRSRMRLDDAEFGVFEGHLSLAQGGGFASVRAVTSALAQPGLAGYWLQVRGDGRRYKLNLRVDMRFDGISYQAAFQPPAGVWTAVRLPLAAFVPTFRGRPVPGAPPLDPAQVVQVGLMIADAQAGPFALALRALGNTR